MEQEMDEGPKRTLGVIAAISECQEGDATTQRLIAVSLSCFLFMRTECHGDR